MSVGQVEKPENTTCLDIGRKIPMHHFPFIFAPNNTFVTKPTDHFHSQPRPQQHQTATLGVGINLCCDSSHLQCEFFALYLESWSACASAGFDKLQICRERGCHSKNRQKWSCSLVDRSTKQHESVTPSICFGFPATSAAPIWRCWCLSWGCKGSAGFAANAIFVAKTEWKVMHWNLMSCVQQRHVYGIPTWQTDLKKLF